MNDPNSWLLAVILVLAGFLLILILIRLITQLPTSSDASRAVLTAKGYQLLGRTTDAIEACRYAIRLDSENAEAHSLLADLLMESGHQTEAASHLRQAAQLERLNDLKLETTDEHR